MSACLINPKQRTNKWYHIFSNLTQTVVQIVKSKHIAIDPGLHKLLSQTFGCIDSGHPQLCTYHVLICTFPLQNSILFINVMKNLFSIYVPCRY